MDAVALAADPDGRVRPLERRRVADGAVDGIVPALEARARLRPHPPDDLDPFRELVDPLPDARERDAVGAVLVLEPARPQTEIEPAAADDVQGGRHLGQDRRGAVRVAEHARAEAQTARVAGQRGERRPALE
jgi:hypothetical protein